MKRFIRGLHIALAISLVFIGCEKDMIFIFTPVDYGPHGDPPIIEVESIRKTGSPVINGFMHDGTFRRAQGMAISGNIMYRFFTTGMCKTYDITNLGKPVEIATFQLGSYGDNNHANSGQFYTDKNGETYVYISGMGKDNAHCIGTCTDDIS